MRRALCLGADAVEDLQKRRPRQWGDIARGGMGTAQEDEDQLKKVNAIVGLLSCKYTSDNARTTDTAAQHRTYNLCVWEWRCK